MAQASLIPLGDRYVLGVATTLRVVGRELKHRPCLSTTGGQVGGRHVLELPYIALFSGVGFHFADLRPLVLRSKERIGGEVA